MMSRFHYRGLNVLSEGGELGRCRMLWSLMESIWSLQEWKYGQLKDVCQRYTPENIYNADESGLLWKMPPENALGFIRSQVHGGKESKTRYTVMVAANMDGSDKLPLLVIGKSEKPCAFKGVTHLPIKYKANRKAWMTSEYFESWVRSLDHSMGQQKRNICLIVDNCPAHLHVEELENIELVFLLPNAMSVTQPVDGGIIRNLKFYYRHILANRWRQSNESDSAFKWDILDTMFALKSAWGKVQQETIASVYRKVGFVSDSVAINEPGDVPAILVSEDSYPDEPAQRQFQNVWSRLGEIFGDTLTTLDQYIDVDASDATVHEVMNDGYIVKEKRATQDTNVIVIDDDSDGDLTDDAEVNEAPSIKQTYGAIDVIRRFAVSLTDTADADDTLAFAQKVENILLKETLTRLSP